MITERKITAVLFDLDGTLLHNLPSGGEVFTDYASQLGLTITGEDRRRAAIWEHYYFANSPEIRQDHAKYNGDGEGDAFWANFSQRKLIALGCPRDLVPELSPRISEHMRNAYRPDFWVPEDTYAVLPALRESGLILGVVSNRDNPLGEALEEVNLYGYFDFTLAAGEINSWKPDTEIFLHAVKLADSNVENTIYIGDNYFADVVGARRAGLQPVLFDNKHLFQDPNCEVISSFSELTRIL